MRETPAHERPRERLLSVGPEHLRATELVAILLRTGTKKAPVNLLAERLLQKFAYSLREVATASIEELCSVSGIGPDKAAAIKAALELARRLSRETAGSSPLLDTPDRVADFLRETLRPLDVETFHLLLVNTRRRLICAERLSQGTLDTVLIHPREVFRRAIIANASALVLVHNHPSGDPTPSEADIRVTRDLIRAGHLLKIEVLDHVILGRSTTDRTRDYSSLRELGYFYC